MNRNRKAKSVAVVQKTPLPPIPSSASVAKQGFSWGIGNALAHTAINRMIGSAEPTPATNTSQNTSPKQVAYTQCMKDFGDAEGCKHLLDPL